MAVVVVYVVGVVVAVVGLAVAVLVAATVVINSRSKGGLVWW